MADRNRHRHSLVEAGLDTGRRELMAINPLEPNKLFEHHPVMRALKLRAFPMQKATLTELNGLRVPVHYDCMNLHNAYDGDGKRRPWGNQPYFRSVLSRWHPCYMHEALVKAGVPFEEPTHAARPRPRHPYL